MRFGMRKDDLALLFDTGQEVQELCVAFFNEMIELFLCGRVYLLDWPGLEQSSSQCMHN